MSGLARRSARRLLRVALPALVSGPIVAGAQDPTDAAAAAQRTVLIVFVSHESLPSPDLHPTLVRRTGSTVLAPTLSETGDAIVTYPEIEAEMREWRVRSERDIGFEFLGALVSAYDASQLVVARFAIYDDRILLLARSLSVESGELLWVDLVEEPRIDAAGGDALEGLVGAMRAAGRQLAGPRTAPVARTAPATLVALPLRPVGLGRGLAGVASQCLLHSLLASGRWSIPDPTLVLFTLQQEGFDPFLLDAESRRFLASRFGTDTVLVPRLASFPVTAQTRSARQGDDGDTDARFTRVSGSELGLFFSVVAIDCGSGDLVSGASEYLAPENPIGTFGRRNDVPAARRFRVGADRLMQSLLLTEGSQ